MKIAERPSPMGVRPRLTEVRHTEPAYQAYSTLYVGFTALPIVAGLDKFTHYLVDWTRYLSPIATRITGLEADTFMMLIGVIEIAAGILVAVKPRWGSFVVGLWLLGIVVNLLAIPGFYDVALRDFGLSLGAFSLWRLSEQYSARGL